ncbi:MAG: hypothetical protein KatS3mg031_1028 [Chitinophagales bacterium]|nr:MAG: hypothetical protein KatS3mg031_1028 [Chitinophagales bacterium]
MIRYIQRHEIHDELWDSCIRNAINSLPYAYSWYLDSAAGNWDALVWGNYEKVFPLVWRKRFFISYLYQPYFTQQLGVFSADSPDAETVRAFLQAIPAHFRFMEIHLNYRNPVEEDGYTVEKRTNLCLNLNRPYVEIAQAYHENTRRNVKKAEKNNLQLKSGLSAEIIIEFFKANTGVKIPELGEFHYEHLEKIIREATVRNMGQTYGVFDNRENLLSAGFFLETPDRVINLLPSVEEGAKELGAGFFLIDSLIRKYAASGKILDFEGSMHPQIARFYNSFGAYEQPYWRVRLNRLPRWMKWIKR